MASELEQTNNDACDFTLRGEILSGDAVKLRPLQGFYFPIKLCLDSEGGSFEEGLKLFDVIWESNIDTYILPGDACDSACAIAFMGGSNVQGTDSTRQIERHLYPGASLGFHAPSLDLDLSPGKTQRTEVVAEAYASALRSAARLLEINQIRERGGATISSFLLGTILRTPPSSEFYRPETIGDLVISGISPAGVSIPYPTTDQFVLNVCRNLLAARPPSDSYLRLARSAEDQYRMVDDPLYDTRADEGEPALDADLPTPSVRVIPNEDGSKAATAGPFFSGTKYGDIHCRVLLPSEQYFSDEGISGGYDIVLHGAGDEEAIEAAMEAIELQQVPDFYMLSPTTLLNELPSDAEAISRIGKPDRLGTETKGILSGDWAIDFRAFVGYDLEVEEDLQSVPRVSQEQCLQRCAEQNDCTAVTYDRWNEYCFLKNSADAVGLSRNTKADTFIRRGFVRDIILDSAELRETVLKGKGFPGSPMSTRPSANIEDCGRACRSETQCVAYQYTDGACALFDRPEAYVDQQGAQVGLFEQ